jgi:hypothetical protein
VTEEFAHRLRIDQIRDGDRLELSANADERAAIARRLGLQSIDRLDAHVTLARSGDAIRARGRLTAALEPHQRDSGERRQHGKSPVERIGHAAGQKPLRPPRFGGQPIEQRGALRGGGR